jgi:hypothetical protein
MHKILSSAVLITSVVAIAMGTAAAQRQLHFYLHQAYNTRPIFERNAPVSDSRVDPVRGSIASRWRVHL